jgi:hypothetical protein
LALALHARVVFFPHDFLPVGVGVTGIPFSAPGASGVDGGGARASAAGTGAGGACSPLIAAGSHPDA